MADNNAVFGALLFIILVIGANLVMYAIARGATRPNNKGFLETIIKSLKPSAKKKDNSMDELRKKLEELKKDKKA